MQRWATRPSIDLTHELRVLVARLASHFVFGAEVEGFVEDDLFAWRDDEDEDDFWDAPNAGVAAADDGDGGDDDSGLLTW